jgi:hypothetical protein
VVDLFLIQQNEVAVIGFALKQSSLTRTAGTTLAGAGHMDARSVQNIENRNTYRNYITVSVT